MAGGALDLLMMRAQASKKAAKPGTPLLASRRAFGMDSSGLRVSIWPTGSAAEVAKL